MCPPGLGGKGCKIVTSSCDQGNPCQHGGTCTDIPETSGVTCECPTGYDGEFCEEDINECIDLAHNPCQAGGTCQNLVSLDIWSCILIVKV